MALALALGGAVQAAPQEAPPPDPLGQLLADKGLLGEVRDNAVQAASDLVVHAMGFLGVPYRLGGQSVDTGFDCSGFVRAVFEQTVGKVLPRRAEQQAAASRPIDAAELRPGDLVFFNTLRRTFSHVGIYVGEGRFIHSPRPGAQVRVEDMRLAYWRTRFDGARRVLDGQGDAEAALPPAPAAPAQPNVFQTPPGISDNR